MSKSKPRVLFIATLPPPVHGAAVVGQQIKDSKLINDEFQCDWINLSPSRYLDEVGKPAAQKILRLTSSFLHTLWLLLSHKYDLCYLTITCYGVGFLKDAPFVLLCKIFCRHIIIHHHNKGMSSDVDRFPYRLLLPLVYKNTKVILLSWHLYYDIEKIVPKENVFICPNGIKLKPCVYDRIERKAQSYPNIIFLSNLIETKGVFVLLDALKLLQDKRYSFHCDFVGLESKEINAQRFEEEVNKRGLNNKVSYLGKKYGAEKDCILEKSDIFVFPTYYKYECFPLVLLEAMKFKLPCITKTEGAILDIVENGKNGFICEKQNPKSLADCISKLLDNKELCKTMGEEGRKRVEDKYTEEIFEQNMIRCFKEFLNQNESK